MSVYHDLTLLKLPLSTMSEENARIPVLGAASSLHSPMESLPNQEKETGKRDDENNKPTQTDSRLSEISNKETDNQLSQLSK